MNITRPLTATALSVAWHQARALFVFSFLVNLLLLVSAVCMLQLYDCVLSSGSLEMPLPLTVATLLAIVTYGALEQVRRLMLGRVGTWRLHNGLGGPLVRRAMQARLAGWAPSGCSRQPRRHRHHHSSQRAGSSRLSISPR